VNDCEIADAVADYYSRASRKAAPGKLPRIVGYAAVYDSRSADLGGFVETIRPGAFDLSLAAGRDVVATIDHNRSKVLGRWPNPGTLRLSADRKGLRVEIDDLPDTSYARDLVESMRRKEIRGMSFAFRTISDNWREETTGGVSVVVRELIDVELHDVSIVTDPAYPAASVGLRSEEGRDHLFEMRLRLATLEAV